MKASPLLIGALECPTFGLLDKLFLFNFSEFKWAPARVNERTELHAAMRRDLEQMSRDAQQTYKSLAMQRTWMMQNAMAAENALEDNRTYRPTSPTESLHVELVSDPAFRSAKASGLLSILSQDEVRAYSELDTLVDANQQAYLLGLGNSRMEAVLFRFGFPGASTDRWSHATPEDLRNFINATTEEIYMMGVTMLINQQVYGAAQAVLQGERDPQKIYQNENKPVPALSPQREPRY